MSTGFNQALILGRLVSAPEQIQTKSGALMIKAIVEVSTYRRSQDGQAEEQKTRIPCTLFSRVAETFQKYVEVNHLVQLIGRLDGYERKSSSGETWLTLNFNVEQLILLPNGRKPNSESSPKPDREPLRTAAKTKGPDRDWDRQPHMKNVATNADGEPEDIPF